MTVYPQQHVQRKSDPKSGAGYRASVVIFQSTRKYQYTKKCENMRSGQPMNGRQKCSENTDHQHYKKVATLFSAAIEQHQIQNPQRRSDSYGFLDNDTD